MGAVSAMMEACYHRGPDGARRWLSPNNRLALGHNLLAITAEPSRSEQPWILEWNDSEEGFALCFNGEIYNHEELRQRLTDPFYRDFPPNECDTSVLACGLYHDGPRFLGYIDGMFALAWYSVEYNSLLLARDRIGQRPLYYAACHKGLAFSSELRGLLALKEFQGAKLDRYATELYMEFGYCAGHHTVVDGIRKLAPGEVCIFKDLSTHCVERSSLLRPTDARREFEPAEFRKALRESVRRSLMGRRKVAIFLSGGLDSTVVAYEAKQLGADVTCYTNRFEGKTEKAMSDANVASRFCKDVDLPYKELFIRPSAFCDVSAESMVAQDEPRYSRSVQAYYLTLKQAHQDGVVVVLTGDGGDEVLTGYPRHEVVDGFQPNLSTIHNRYKEKNWDFYNQRNPIVRWHSLTSMNVGSADPKHIRERMPGFLSRTIDQLSSWLDGCFTQRPVQDQLFLERVTHLAEQYLIRMDKLGMWFGIESRFPLLVDPFRSYVESLPDNELLHGGAKNLTRRAYAGLIPDYVLNKPKTGWSIPLHEWTNLKQVRRTHKEKSPLGQLLVRHLYKDSQHLQTWFDVSKAATPKSIFMLFSLALWTRKMGVKI